ncbi:HNH endonuclease signature motif containing protein [Exiguobacterium antarcticum]|uniref:HNH endonuclease signature motif containing protein n=1 Tax=Exiguobacterium antarcticum TaxID=132920 RepID=A0ABT6R066_9BACL|nr:HNH endonuclease signature motif containing protein [Exiguobacterium antarcticum]MDI3234192.1 HNH endonuclease signature motif containing protein [Exiguobacterium antarcticum]
MAHRYTAEQRLFIVNHVQGRTTEALTDLVNTHFGINLSTNQIRAYKKNNKLLSGVDAKFQKGRTSHNKGKSTGGWKPTQFKQGHRPYNYMPVGSERVNGEGYVDIKIADPNKWRGKHLILWEEAHGPVPEGHVILFGDQDRRNFDLDNLLLISKKQLCTLNRRRLIQRDTELTRSAILVTDLIHKIASFKKHSNASANKS